LAAEISIRTSRPAAIVGSLVKTCLATELREAVFAESSVD
jgi:hypothetical protein